MASADSGETNPAAGVTATSNIGVNQPTVNGSHTIVSTGDANTIAYTAISSAGNSDLTLSSDGSLTLAPISIGTGALIATFRAGINNGVDIVGKAGDAIAAVADGRVLYAGSGFHGNGKLIIMRHSTDYLSIYVIAAELLVVEGQAVKRSQKIAVIGGNDAAESSVHFEIHFHGKPVDPQKHLPPR